MDKLYNCIEMVAKNKGLTTQEYINQAQEEGYRTIKAPLGIYGKAVLSKEIEKKGEDIYVPGLEVMTGFNYRDRDMKSGNDYKIKKEYNVPDAPIGWWISEKFDGQRAVWDGEKFISRGGSSKPRVYPYVPRWFMALMPPGIALDGELFMDRQSFSSTTSLLKTKKGNQQELDTRWLAIKFMVFDIIENSLYEERKKKLNEIVLQRCEIWKLIFLPPYLKKRECPLVLAKQTKVNSQAELDTIYSKLVSQGAEGVMVRAPGIPYISRRTKMMLKIKSEDDSECRIINYKPGEGKYENKLGSFLCEDLITKKQFYIGGMNDLIRSNYLTTHPIGTVITYQFNDLTADGIPRHPRYKGIY